MAWLSAPWLFIRQILQRCSISSGKAIPSPEAKVRETQTPLARCLDDFEGSTIVIPNIGDLSPVWVMDVNPHLEHIRCDYNAWVRSWFKDEKIRDKIAALDADGFAAMAYPRTGRNELLNIARLIAWYFPWDDAIDDPVMRQQPANVDQYRDETIAVVEESLLSALDQPLAIHQNPAIQSFWDIGFEIRKNSNADSNARFSHQQCLFIKASAEALSLRKDEEPVSVQHYLRRREDNIAIHQLMELSFYTYKVSIPSQWRHENNEHMREMWKEIAWMGIMSNDLLSLRRELIHGQFESLVPLLMYHDGLTPQAAVDRGTKMIHDSYDRFYDRERRLLEEVSPVELDSVKACLQVFKDLVMCNLHWSYGLKRYMDPEMIKSDGTVVFDIRLPAA